MLAGDAKTTKKATTKRIESVFHGESGRGGRNRVKECKRKQEQQHAKLTPAALTTTATITEDEQQQRQQHRLQFTA